MEGNVSNKMEVNCNDVVDKKPTDIDLEEMLMKIKALDAENFTPAEEALDAVYRQSGSSFFQHAPCYKFRASVGQQNSTIPVCRECFRAREKHHAKADHVYCRFYEFRLLHYEPNGKLIFDGFSNPYLHPKQKDINIWDPDAQTKPTVGSMTIQECRQILLYVGDQFCDLWQEEIEALTLHTNPQNIIAWKKSVQGIREICDVCDTTLFNYHWTCDKCGFSVCLDCFKDRKNKRSVRSKSLRPERGRDDYHWLLCVTDINTSAAKHNIEKLMLTQIIPGDALSVLGHKLHLLRALWKVPQVCGCLLSKMEKSIQSSHASVIETIEEAIAATDVGILDRKLTSSRKEESDKFKTTFYRDGSGVLRRFIPTRTLFITQTDEMINANVEYEVLCNGKLLVLEDPTNAQNQFLFQEVWKCGQPVMIAKVNKCLDFDLWHPDAFCRDFGDIPNDLINCLNGNLVPNQPMRLFWEGFQCMNKRLLDANGKPMLLKLKDWPPGDDFAEILPKRFEDLMKGLPMPQYTLRTGKMNLVSSLPKMFVPPDLGPKMYNAYGSSSHPDKGTTNLHLDISDAVNIMVYVGIPKDSNDEEQNMASYNAIRKGDCDFITRGRVICEENTPGALWHIFEASDADKIRDLLKRVTLERGYRLQPDHDPIHDQNWYLDHKLRQRLFTEYKVRSYPIVQCLGDAIFIPAGAPHQVQNLHNCIKVAEDFVSPQNISHCYQLTHEFRRLSHSHTNHEDKLQIKNIIYHSIKDCCTILERILAQIYRDKLSEVNSSYRQFLANLYWQKMHYKNKTYINIKRKYFKFRNRGPKKYSMPFKN